MSKLNERLILLQKTLKTLQEVLLETPTAIERDAAIQRFEYCFELAWKCLKDICFIEGFVVNSPKEAIKKSFLIAILTDEITWVNMLEDRNRSSHTYLEIMAEEIYAALPNYYNAMNECAEKIADAIL